MNIFILVENLTLLNNLHYGSIYIFLSWKGTNKLQHRFDKYEIIQLFPVTRHEVLSIVNTFDTKSRFSRVLKLRVITITTLVLQGGYSFI